LPAEFNKGKVMSSSTDPNGSPLESRLYEGRWNHLFGPGRAETQCRIVVDVESDSLIVAHAFDGLKWVDLSAAEKKDLSQSLFDGNDVSADPESFSLAPVRSLPQWATPRDMPAISWAFDGIATEVATANAVAIGHVALRGRPDGDDAYEVVLYHSEGEESPASGRPGLAAIAHVGPEQGKATFLKMVEEALAHDTPSDVLSVMSIVQPAALREIRLHAHDIVVTFSPQGGYAVRSSLHDDSDGPEEKAALDAVEAMILAHAVAGIDVNSPAYLEGIETVVEAIWNHCGEAPAEDPPANTPHM
jgi:hypothetical protein